MIPFSRRIVFLSPLSPDEAAKALESAIENRKDWKKKALSTGSGRFSGEIIDLKFTIKREISYRNSFLPNISGTIAPGDTGSRIEVTMGIHPAAGAFIAVWAFVLIYNFYNAMHFGVGGAVNYSFLAPLCFMLALGLGMTMIGFVPEVAKADKFLIETLKAEKERKRDFSREAI